MPNPIRDLINHIFTAGQFNEGRAGAVSGNDLPPEVKRRVDQLAAQRDVLSRLEGPEAAKQTQDLQQAINYLYNPRTRGAAVASWASLRGDEHNPWSATGGHLGTAAGMVNDMTLRPDTFYYGGRRGGPNVPRGARVSPD